MVAYAIHPEQVGLWLYMEFGNSGYV